MRCQRAVLQKPTRKLPEKGFPLAPSWCHPPEGRAQAPWSPPCPKPRVPSPTRAGCGQIPELLLGKKRQEVHSQRLPPAGQPSGAACRGSSRYFCLLPAEQLTGRAVPAQPWGPGRGRSVLGQSSSSVSSSQAAWLFLAVVMVLRFCCFSMRWEPHSTSSEPSCPLWSPVSCTWVSNRRGSSLWHCRRALGARRLGGFAH